MSNHLLLAVTDADVQYVARETIGRKLHEDELDDARRFVENSTRWHDIAEDAVWFATRKHQ